ncbi:MULTISPECIES: DedA family protein [Aneurinibacillus]|jgi:membrane protein DedA with SNARE-associated domain|uniref:Alkaline phosphatase n=1 Tax=Aneurinibacillus danicus TaxID=267746 RepID=A0A511VAF9_9BACL|nr:MULTISPECIES: DedA family protein [Aneurinibacillus]GEN35905.1 alkaline phosphatase [Aneurinibacillus danicus]
MGQMLETIGSWITAVIDYLGYAGVFLGMLLESACIPVPSELIMPFAGFLASQGKMNLLAAIVAGSIGGTIGCVVAYVIGRKYGHLLEGPLRFVFPLHEVRRAQRWLARHGDSVGFFTRLLPAVRTFISLPMGMAHAPFLRFVVYSFVGTAIWCTVLAYVGWMLGENWAMIKAYLHYGDVFVLIACGALVVYYVWKRKKRSRFV